MDDDDDDEESKRSDEDGYSKTLYTKFVQLIYQPITYRPIYTISLIVLLM